jgi:NTP pyrophosphatase (non-canonical NTP hydrolase)
MSNEAVLRRVGVMCQVEAERVRQDEQWGQQDHEPTVYMTILTKEVGEAAKEAIEWWMSARNGMDVMASRHLDLLREELVQVAAVAVAMVECLDRDEWKPGRP